VNDARNALTELQTSRVIGARDAAQFLGVSLSTFRRLYWAKKIPPPLQLSERRLGWRIRDLMEHLDKLRADA
jgi:prophage regulatory protein